MKYPELVTADHIMAQIEKEERMAAKKKKGDNCAVM